MADEHGEDLRRSGRVDDEEAGSAPAQPTLGGPVLRDRRTLSLGQVAARLEHRLYTMDPSPEAVRDGCELALRHGLAGVIVRPAAVPLAGLHVAGTSVGVVTVPGWREEEVEELSTVELLAEARRLADEGATDLGLLAGAARLDADRGRQFADDVTALVREMQPRGVRVRVVLDTDGFTRDALVAACRLLGGTGAWLVQGGSWHGQARTGLSQVQLMRAALPATVRLKWTFPIRSLDSMMICVAEGVDRFNADPQAILQEAQRRIAVGRLVVPDRYSDY